MSSRISLLVDVLPTRTLDDKCEPCTMPANDRFRFHQDQRLSPPGPAATQRNQEKSVAIRGILAADGIELRPRVVAASKILQK
jgi:hypothetical protein